MRLILRYPIILILAFGLICAALLLNEHLVPAGDNSTYLVLGQALVTGQGYKMISDPRSPDMGLYAPGYPFLLAGVLALTGTQHDLLAAIVPCKLLSVALYLGIVLLVYLLLRERDPTLATIAALLTAVNPSILYFAAEIGTEIPYLFVSLACLWAFERYLRQPSTGALAWTVILLVLAFYIRSIAVVIAVAFSLYLVSRRRIKQALLLAVAVAVLELPWFIRGQALPDTGTAVGLGRGYFNLYFTSDPYGTAPASLADWVARLAQNVRLYVFDIWPTVLFPHAARIGASLGALGSAFVLLITLFLALGFILEAWRRHVSEWYVAVFFASCVTYMWAQSRLIVPIIPFALFYFLVAVRSVLQLAQPKRDAAALSGPNPVFQTEGGATAGNDRLITTYALGVACAVLALSALVAEARAVQRNLSYGAGKPLATYYAGSAEWGNYLQAMNWIARNSSEDSAVICRKADLMYIVTRRRAMEYPYTRDGVALANGARDNHIAYVIEDAFGWTGTTDDYLRPALKAWRATEPEALSVAFETDAPRTVVWRVVNTD